MKKLATLTLGTCLAFGSATLCLAQANNSSQYPNNSNTATSPNTNTNEQNNPNGTMNNQGTSTNPNDTGAANTNMPKTAANWLPMLLSGGFLSGAGLVLRRRTRKIEA